MAIPIAAATAAAGAVKGAANIVGKNLPLIIGLSAAVVLIFWLKPLIRRLAGLVPDDAPYFVGGGDVLASFAKSGRNRVNRLHGGLKKGDAWFSETDLCPALQEAINWNDNQLIFIHNEYKNRYGITLYDSIVSAGGDGCPWNWADYDEDLKDRLSQLGLV